MASVELITGAKMPMVGLGTWKSSTGEVETAVYEAIKAGYRHIDCAAAYDNETEVGKGLKKAMDEGLVTREELFITSKLWNTCHAPNDVKPSLMETLSDLDLTYVDLYLIHWPHAFKPGKNRFPKDDDGNVIYADIHYKDTWQAMEKCVEEGLIKSIGLSNFNTDQIQDLLDNAKIKPANLQVEIHPFFSQDSLVQFCNKNNISVTAYSPFCSPDRSNISDSEPSVLKNEKLLTIAEEHKKSVAQVTLKWLVKRGIIVVPKSVSAERIKQNIEIFDFNLTDDDMDTINSLNKDERRVAPYVSVDGKSQFRDKDAPYFPFIGEHSFCKE